ncbi:MAG TPA: hypothetical protein VMG82_24275 [Candidatus Sulfotelmatobacter sp.]|nr:hypothetical protein [Candidatus Sulfotelmatobacter sp.]
MSKQFQLFLTPTDAVNLVEKLRVRFGARLLSKKSPSIDPVEIQSPIEHESIFEASGATSIFCYLAPANARIITKYYPTLRLWLTDHWDSEAIEFSGCDFDGKTLRVGRFYFQTDDLVDGSIVGKKAEFLQWADRVFRYVKKALTRERGLMGPVGAYVGKDALLFRENGGKFAESLSDAGVRISPPVTPGTPSVVQ